ncbi:unnamed protein product [Musa acuminata subsp. malaccensis]|uniref:(wild Malaysian banana) hypothetical protein n=1 Tax=Musa acuminata subsp. malaccensis TaxID=214687 RepID=A0A804JSL9_MUSAM|nr:PREDICTED: uncharacterized protein LOC103990526 [Musa acuminata subsp. malaccensis]CAG1855737.1 unnamed protein product [Musa acuminata subsp. malaccensis]
MALAFSLRHHPRIASPLRPSLPRPRPRRLPFCVACVRPLASPAPGQGEAARGGSALVWFKNDLRVDDHPGLVAAVAKHETVVPLYVFDHRILSDLSDEMRELLLFSVKELKELLKGQGSDLLLGFGSTEDVILELVNKVKPSHIYAEEEVEYNLRKLATTVESSLSAVPFSWGNPEFIFWRTPFYDFKNLKELSASYHEFTKLKLSISLPMPAPAIPVLSMELKTSALPSLVDVKNYLDGAPCQLDDSWISLKKASPMSILKRNRNQNIMKTDPAERGEYYDEKGKETSSTFNNVRSTKISNSMFVSQEGSLVKGGTNTVLNALAAYLRYLEGTARDDWQELHDKLRRAERRKGASFNALFGSALYFGTISRRRVYYEAIKYEKERNGGFLSPFGYSAPTVAAAVDAVCSMEWYSVLALKSQICNEGVYPVWIWRWKGHFVQYTAVGNEGPAALLVHGFGAFLEHFRGNISTIADGGNRVWAISLLGFGKSEKPNVIYTELLWAELLRDFIVDVVREPVHLVGNSLGGYFVATVAGLWPSLVKSLVLINTAGSIVPTVSSIPSVDVKLIQERKISGLAWLQAQLLLLFLRSTAGKFIEKCYPTNVERVDGWLLGEILRASFDPGAAIVMESIVSFDLSIPLNYLLGSFGGEVLIIQGMKDPLTKSKAFLSMVREHCNKVTVSELDAGHCPHDEVPQKVNSTLREWITRVESSLYILERA